MGDLGSRVTSYTAVWWNMFFFSKDTSWHTGVHGSTMINVWLHCLANQDPNKWWPYMGAPMVLRWSLPPGRHDPTAPGEVDSSQSPASWLQIVGSTPNSVDWNPGSYDLSKPWPKPSLHDFRKWIISTVDRRTVEHPQLKLHELVIRHGPWLIIIFMLYIIGYYKTEMIPKPRHSMFFSAIFRFGNLPGNFWKLVTGVITAAVTMSPCRSWSVERGHQQFC